MIDLVGRTLPGDWLVVSRHEPSLHATGGFFSNRYSVENTLTGAKGFLKVLDYSEAFNTPDPARAVQSLVEQFNFERDLLEHCKGENCSRIVTAIEDGSIHVPGSQPPKVQYIIFEVAEGDIRGSQEWPTRDDAFNLIVAHESACALRQIHKVGIAHQDLKPSNVLIFPKHHKLADLGRASQLGIDSPCDEFQIAGQISYAPIEQLYGYISNDWRERRLGGDLYLLGNLIYYLYTEASITAVTVSRLHPTLSPKEWTGTYEDILPYLAEAHEQALQELDSASSLPDKHTKELKTIVRALTTPAVWKRGDTSRPNRDFSQANLERFISRLSTLRKRAELAYK